MRKHYETPETEVIEVVMQGMLAQSTESEIQDYSNSFNLQGMGNEEVW